VQPSWYKVVGEEFVSEGWAGDVLTVFGSFADGHEDYAGSVLVFLVLRWRILGRIPMDFFFCC